MDARTKFDVTASTSHNDITPLLLTILGLRCRDSFFKFVDTRDFYSSLELRLKKPRWKWDLWLLDEQPNGHAHCTGSVLPCLRAPQKLLQSTSVFPAGPAQVSLLGPMQT